MATLLIKPIPSKRADNQVQVNLGSIRDEYVVSLLDPFPLMLNKWGCVDETKKFIASMHFPIVRVYKITKASKTQFYDELPAEAKIYAQYLNEIDWNDEKLAGISQQVKDILQRQGVLLKDEEEKEKPQPQPVTTRQLFEQLLESIKDQRMFTVKPRRGKKSRPNTNKLFVFTRDFSSEELEEINHYDDVELVSFKKLDQLVIDSGIEIYVDNIDKLMDELKWWSKA